MEPAIWKITRDYVDRLASAAGTDRTIELKELWNGLTQEVIGRYCFGAENMSALREGRDEAEYLGLFDRFPQIFVHEWGRQFPWAFDALTKVPAGVLARLHPAFARTGRFQAQIRRQIEAVLERGEPLVGAKNVFQEMRDGKHLAPRDRSMRYYQAEAISFIGAGTETTAGSLTAACYYLLANPHTLQKLRAELRTVMPDGGRDRAPTIAELEALPYLVRVPHFSPYLLSDSC